MKQKKNKIFLSLLASTLLVGGLASCSFFPEGTYDPNNPGQPEGGETEQGGGNEGGGSEGNKDPDEIRKVNSIEVNGPKEYIVGDNADANNKFKVKATLSDDSVINVDYHKSTGTRWVFEGLYDEDLIGYSDIPTTFKKITSFTYKVKVIFNGKNYVSKDSYNFNVYGGTKSSVAPLDLSLDVVGKNYTVGETFDPSSIQVSGYWNQYGGNDIIVPGDGENGYTYKISGVENGQPFTREGEYKITVTYRGIPQVDTIYVRKTPTHVKEEVNYDYQNLSDDSYYPLDYMPASGRPKALIIPVWFTDSAKYISEKDKDLFRQSIEIAYLGTKEDTGWHSVRTYYLEDSFGKLHIDGEVSPWFESGISSSQVNSGPKTSNLTKKAAAWYRNLLMEHGRGDEWTSFDTNKDGYLDAVILIYAAPNYHNSNDPVISKNENLWAYCFWVQDPNLQSVKNPGPNVYFWASIDFLLPEGQPEGSPIIVDAHTYIHEMGHILGLEDYYDYAAREVSNAPAGAYTMQDNNVGGHDPFSRLAYGWLNPYVPQESTIITLNDFESSGDVIVLCPDWDGSAFNEYIIMDYWTPTGLNELDCTYQYGGRYPMGPQETGLRLWHVDARLRPVVGGTLGDLTTRPDPNQEVVLAMSNSTDDGNSEGYVSAVPEDRNYDLLALLNASKKNELEPYPFMDSFSKEHLWDVGSTFSMEEYQSMFTNGDLLNSGKQLGYSIEVLSKTSKTITVQITKG